MKIYQKLDIKSLPPKKKGEEESQDSTWKSVLKKFCKSVSKWIISCCRNVTEKDSGCDKNRSSNISQKRLLAVNISSAGVY